MPSTVTHEQVQAIHEACKTKMDQIAPELTEQGRQNGAAILGVDIYLDDMIATTRELIADIRHDGDDRDVAKLIIFAAIDDTCGGSAELVYALLASALVRLAELGPAQ